jgi:hypothetical protein
MSDKYKIAYNVQKRNAALRGIAWEITFEEWLAWWGDDIGRRGRGECDLQMQRIADSGPYKLGNIKKGVPLQNAKTAAIMKMNEACERAAEIRRAASAELMEAEAGDRLRETMDDNERELHAMFWFKTSNQCFDLLS